MQGEKRSKMYIKQKCEKNEERRTRRDRLRDTMEGRTIRENQYNKKGKKSEMRDPGYEQTKEFEEM